jgi:hypothetical protein
MLGLTRGRMRENLSPRLEAPSLARDHLSGRLLYWTDRRHVPAHLKES